MTLVAFPVLKPNGSAPPRCGAGGGFGLLLREVGDGKGAGTAAWWVLTGLVVRDGDAVAVAFAEVAAAEVDEGYAGSAAA